MRELWKCLTLLIVIVLGTSCVVGKEALPESKPFTDTSSFFYAESLEPKVFFGPRYFLFFEIPDWPEWLSWSRFL